eukprot:jgi/Ulvmu1/337/UM001_0341.1
MFSGSYRRVPIHHLGRRPAPNRPLINCVVILLAFAFVYICCFLVSVVRTQRPQRSADGWNSSIRVSQQAGADADRINQELQTEFDTTDVADDLYTGQDQDIDDEADQVDDEDEQDDDRGEEDPKHEPPPGHIDSVSGDDPPNPLARDNEPPEKEHNLPYPPEIIGPNRTRAQTIQYSICPASAHTVPGFGPLYLLDRGQAPSCAVYLYPAVYGLSRPTLPRLPPLSKPQPDSSPPLATRRRLTHADPAQLHDTGAPFSSAFSAAFSAGIGEHGRARQLLGRPMPEDALRDSDVSIGVLAAAVDLAAQEQLGTETKLEQVLGLRTPASTSQLPPDLGHWTHIQLQKAQRLHAAWRGGDAAAASLHLPHSIALLQHPARAALVREFAHAAACLLRQEGGPGAAALEGAGDLDALAASVISWPQTLGYDNPEHMPTGRETTLPGTLMRGVFIAREVGSVMIDTYDPRGPLDSMEVQDLVNDMYKVELRTGDLLIFPSWVQTSILVLPPSTHAAARGKAPPAPNRVAQAAAAGLALGFAPGFGAADAPPPPQAASASVLHLALPGYPPATAAAVLPLRIPPSRPSPTPAPAADSPTPPRRANPPPTSEPLRVLAMAAFEAFRRCFPEDGNDDEHEYPGSLGDDLFAYQSHWPNTRDYPCTGGLAGADAEERAGEWQRAFATYVMGAMHQRMLTAVSTVVTSLLQGLGKPEMVQESPGMFSWLTVHDVSTSFHGRHYHRDQGMTAVLYISDPAPDSAPLEFSNPIVGSDSVPNGRVTFKPQRGDFVIFPSFLSHTVPMRHLQDRAQPRISIAFNIWFRGPGLSRYAEGMPEEDRDEVGHHQYVSMSDVVLDKTFRPSQGMPIS